MTTTTNRPLPEALGRWDVEPRSGAWDVRSCEPTRGIPVTSVEQRFMKVPMGDDELSQVVRAHELVHAKVSPRDLTPWIDRGFASDDAMRAVEEVRVNYLASTLGYNTKILVDGSEMTSGERAVALNDWHGAVMFAVAVAGTDGSKKFLTGVRRHNKVWADVLADMTKRLMKEVKKVGAPHLSSTLVLSSDGLIEGFAHVERLAEWVDRFAGTVPDSGSGDSESDDTDKTDKRDDSTDEASTPTPTKPRKRGRPRKDETKTDGAVSRSRTTDFTRGEAYNPVPSWMKLKVEKVPLPDVLSGALGKKRVASATGKNPRRLTRLLTDPQRRVFDKTVRGKGGIVVVDCSGSMSLSREQVRQVVLASPGCTVLAYTVSDWAIGGDGEAERPNAWVLAHEGRICDRLPFERGAGNGVDLPVLQWAVKNRKRQSVPIVWVSDGCVTGMGDNSHPMLAIKTFEFVMKHNITVVSDTESAVKYLTNLAKGDKMPRSLPSSLTFYAKEYGLITE